MLTLEKFAKLLHMGKVPSYAYPRVEPEEVFNSYKFSMVHGTRRIASSNSSKHSRKEETYSIDAEMQKDMWVNLVQMDSIMPYVIAVSGSVNDYLAHEVASTLLLQLARVHRDLRWKWVTTRFDPYKQSDILEPTNPDVVVIRSILPQEGRSYNVKDILDYYNNSMKIVIIGGMHGIEYFDDYLRSPLNGVLHVEGRKGRTPPEIILKDEKKNVIEKDEFQHPVFVVDNVSKNILQNLTTIRLKKD